MIVLLMGVVVIVVGVDSFKFVMLFFINIVIVVNVGGVFSLFGDIMILMVW